MFARLFGLLLAFGFFGGASGQLIQRPTFSYTFNPPIQWTCTPNTTLLFPRQATNIADANRTMVNDVVGAITTAFQQAGFGLYLSSTQFAVSGYVPAANVTISTQNTALTYVPEIGAVTGFRSTVSQIDPYVQSQQVRVTQSSLFLLKSQWQTVATFLQSNLNVLKSVRFVTQITVS
ncbi:hypothetical protein M3Y99_01812800 [Aphelenchoides fujianensis]|nr:hypothetical protein M3Y99_01812800 [Aphelenchoides fujianensis]